METWSLRMLMASNFNPKWTLAGLNTYGLQTSMFIWRLLNDKIPTYEKLMERGCNLPSICNLCLSSVETTYHLFFNCSYAVRLWSWLASSLNLSIHAVFSFLLHLLVKTRKTINYLFLQLEECFPCILLFE